MSAFSTIFLVIAFLDCGIAIVGRYMGDPPEQHTRWMLSGIWFLLLAVHWERIMSP